MINEPYLQLDNPKWGELEGGYRGVLYDASFALKNLEQAMTLTEVNTIYKVLWDELHHQGDVGIASYYAVPHLIRIAKQTQLINYNVLNMVSVIEICRHKNNPVLPKELEDIYHNAIVNLEELAYNYLKTNTSLDIVACSLTAIAVSKNQNKLAEALLRLNSEQDIDYFMENY